MNPGLFDHMMRRRQLLRTGALAAGATGSIALLSSCGDNGANGNGGDPTGGSTETSTNGGGGGGGVELENEVTLKIVGFRVNPEEQGSQLDLSYQKFLEDFQNEHPKIKIDSLETPPDFETQLLVDLAAGTAPDLWSQDASSLAALTDRQLLLDMRKCMEVVPELTTERFFPATLDIHQREDGAIYGLPNDFTPMVTYFNPELFDAAGIEQPSAGWTWDDQLEAAKALTVDKSGNHPGDSGFDPEQIESWGYRASKNAYMWVYRLWANGGDVLSPEFDRASGFLDSDASLEAMQWYVDLVREHQVSPSPSALDRLTQQSSFTAQFIAGRFAMFDSGHWSLVGFSEAEGFRKELLNVAPLPKGKEEATVLYESSFCARSDLDEDQIKAVAMLVNELTGPRWQEAKKLTGIAIPANQQIAEESLDDPESIFADLDGAFIEAAASGRPPAGSYVAKYPTIETALNDMMEAMMRSGDVEGEVAKTVTAIDRELGA